ncbi:hypothetical protein HAX54_052977 [Datura stramonium]|uniref:F-box domain-containing protein n=1 Tax=Datura stramonium TaxID=4076 RepID=A0ABS8T0P7_DATST|nr:hypothetical protein [Datura stramonium]
MPKKKLEKSRLPAYKDDTSILSCDILFCIIIRLPVKSLLRFQCVSKPWRAIISDREFKKSHRDQSKEMGREKMLLGRKSGEFEFSKVENSELITMEEQRIPLKGFQRTQILCSCDGLVLLKSPRAFKIFVLWNPSTREYRALRCPYLNVKEEIVLPTACGLCYDSRVDDYKRLFPYVDRTSTIIYFDIKSDEVKELPTPGFVGEDKIFQFLLLRRCLCLYGGKIMSKESDIWIMEQDGRWKWLMNVCNMPSICGRFVRDMKLLYCTENGEVVFQENDTSQIFMYNHKRQQFVRVYDKKVSPLIASICLDSLYFSTPNVKRKRKQRSPTPNNMNSR